MAFNKQRLQEEAKFPSIHELAVAYGRQHQGTVDIEVFEAGAMEVIEWLEHIFKSPLYDGWDRAQIIKDKLKELKGK